MVETGMRLFAYGQRQPVSEMAKGIFSAPLVITCSGELKLYRNSICWPFSQL